MLSKTDDQYIPIEIHTRILFWQVSYKQSPSERQKDILNGMGDNN